MGTFKDETLDDFGTQSIIDELKRRRIGENRMPKFIPIETIIDENKYSFLVENWDKITLDKLENCIK